MNRTRTLGVALAVADSEGIEAVGIRCFREGGSSVPMAAHAVSTVDSYVRGFVLQEVNLPFRNESELVATTGAIMDRSPRADFPYLFELTIEHVLKPDYSYGNQFDVGLEVVTRWDRCPTGSGSQMTHGVEGCSPRRSPARPDRAE